MYSRAQEKEILEFIKAVTGGSRPTTSNSQDIADKLNLSQIRPIKAPQWSGDAFRVFCYSNNYRLKFFGEPMRRAFGRKYNKVKTVIAKVETKKPASSPTVYAQVLSSNLADSVKLEILKAYASGGSHG